MYRPDYIHALLDPNAADTISALRDTADQRSADTAADMERVSSIPPDVAALYGYGDPEVNKARIFDANNAAALPLAEAVSRGAHMSEEHPLLDKYLFTPLGLSPMSKSNAADAYNLIDTLSMPMAPEKAAPRLLNYALDANDIGESVPLIRDLWNAGRHKTAAAFGAMSGAGAAGDTSSVLELIRKLAR